jgi:hypothetical protein
MRIATRYGLDGPGIEPLWGEIFLTRPDTSRVPQVPVPWVLGINSGACAWR